MHSDGCGFDAVDLLFAHSVYQSSSSSSLALFAFTSLHILFDLELPFFLGKNNDRRHQNGA